VPDTASRRPVRPLMGFRGAPRTRTRRTRTVIGSARPVRRFHAPRGVILRASPRPKPGVGPPCAFVPLQRYVPRAPHRGVEPDGPKADEPRPVPRCCLSWASMPYDTIPGRRTRLMAADPSTAACHVRGLATPYAASTTGPPGARSAGASLGFAPQGVPFGARGAPLGVPALLTLPAAAPPRRGTKRGRLPAGPSSRVESVLSPGSRGNPAVDAFLGFPPPELSPHPPGPPLVVTAPALSPSRRMTSLPAWTSGLRGSDGSAWSVSGLPALMGFCTLRPSRHSVHRPGERAHGFTSRRTPRKARRQLRSELPRQRCSRGS
jgi:hypothetical protein